MNSNLKLKHIQFGIKQGNFSPSNQAQDQFLLQVEKVKKLLPVSVAKIFAPSADFTNKLAMLGEDDDILTPWLIRTNNKADAGMITGAGIAIAFFNGDCPILCLQENNKLAVLHLGYRCIIRENPNEEGLIETAMKYFNPKKTKTFIFGGIGPCCWIPEPDKLEIQKPEKCRHPEILAKCLSKTTLSPLGKNLVSVDLYKLSRLILIKLGVAINKISAKPGCACCAKKNNKPIYWSHTRFLADGGIDGRNFSAAWLE